MAGRPTRGIMGVALICFILLSLVTWINNTDYASRSLSLQWPAPSNAYLQKQSTGDSTGGKKLQEVESEDPSEDVGEDSEPEEEKNDVNTEVEQSPPPKMDMEEIMNLKSDVRGFYNKSGILNPKQWMGKFATDRKKVIKKWILHSVSVNNTDEPIQPPVQWPGCLVHVNHHYKFIWIKGKKVGGTSLRENLGWICGDHWKAPNANYKYCSERVYEDSGLWIKHAKEWWKDYFVFAFVRNPYSRFASSYTYINSLMSGCPLPTFKSVCKDPFLQAKTCGMLNCCWKGAVQHHIHHVMEQASCLFTEDGKMAVDYVGETETISEDFKVIAKEINKRRKQGVPALNEKLSVGHANSNKKSSDNYAVDLFKKYPGCVDDIKRNFKTDFERLGYTEMRDS